MDGPRGRLYYSVMQRQQTATMGGYKKKRSVKRDRSNDGGAVFLNEVRATEELAGSYAYNPKMHIINRSRTL